MFSGVDDAEGLRGVFEFFVDDLVRESASVADFNSIKIVEELLGIFDDFRGF